MIKFYDKFYCIHTYVITQIFFAYQSIITKAKCSMCYNTKVAVWFSFNSLRSDNFLVLENFKTGGRLWRRQYDVVDVVCRPTILTFQGILQRAARLSPSQKMSSVRIQSHRLRHATSRARREVFLTTHGICWRFFHKLKHRRLIILILIVAK